MYFFLVPRSHQMPLLSTFQKKNCWSRSWPFINISSLKMHILVAINNNIIAHYVNVCEHHILGVNVNLNIVCDSQPSWFDHVKMQFRSVTLVEKLCFNRFCNINLKFFQKFLLIYLSCIILQSVNWFLNKKIMPHIKANILQDNEITWMSPVKFINKKAL